MAIRASRVFGSGLQTRRHSLSRKTLTVLARTGLALTVVLAVAGGLLLWGSTYVHNSVQNQLAAQQVFFPPKAAFAHPKVGTEITPNMIPSVSQYAGTQLLTGQQAEAYADHFIAQHLQNMAPGQTYASLSAKSLAQPNNAKLAGLVDTVFRGDSLRAMLLNAYGWWKVSHITSIAAFLLSGLSLIGAGAAFMRRRVTTAVKTAIPAADTAIPEHAVACAPVCRPRRAQR